MRYAEPEAIGEAVALLIANEQARCLAGGAALMTAINAGIAVPEMLISLHRIPSLFGITESTETVSIGPMTSHRAVAADERLAGATAVVRSAASQLASPAIRNMGTIGGSIGLADPNTEIPGALVAASAEVEITGPGGVRTVPVAQVFAGRFQNTLQPGEIITKISIPKGIAGAVGHHLRLSRVQGDYPTVSVSLVLAMSGNTCTYARVVFGSCAPVPLHVAAADTRLIGSALSDQDIADAGALIAAAAQPIDDVRGSASYRLTLIPRLLKRAISEAREVANV